MEQNTANQPTILPLQGAGGHSRDKILAAVTANQPSKVDLPDISLFKKGTAGSLEQFTQVLSNVGGRVGHARSWDEIASMIKEEYGTQRVVTPITELTGFQSISPEATPHELEDVELAVIKAHFGVAENSAVWVTEDNMGMRVLPFIAQHLAVVIEGGEIVPTMAEAYDKVAELPVYGFASFIAGPSKTADIEQSLVIGAHGPKSMTVFLLK